MIKQKFRDFMDCLGDTARSCGWAGIAIVDGDNSQSFTLHYRGSDLIFAFVRSSPEQDGDYVTFVKGMREAGHKVYLWSVLDYDKIKEAYDI